MKLSNLSDLTRISKGLSYKGAYLDQPGAKLVGLGALSPDCTLLHDKMRLYGGPYKPGQRVTKDDVLIALTDITQTGNTLGTVVKPESNLQNAIYTHHIAAIRVKSSGTLLPCYLFYSLQTTRARSYFNSVATGTTVRSVSTHDAGAYQIYLPDIAKQASVVNRIRPIDEKIYLIDRMEFCLDELITRLYYDMFVTSGSSHRPMTTLSELVDINPRTYATKGECYSFVDMKALPTRGPIVSRVGERPYIGGAKFINGDTLLARITPCLENGKGALVTFLRKDETGTGSTELIVLRARGGTSRYWPYALTKQVEFREYAIARMTGSSGRQRVSADAIANFPVPAFQESRMREFDKAADAIIAHLLGLTEQRQNLLDLRARLVQRLIT